jgi:hypothetical protein
LGRVLDDIVEEVTAKLAATSSTLPDTDPGSRSSRATLRASERVEEVTAARGRHILDVGRALGGCDATVDNSGGRVRPS